MQVENAIGWISLREEDLRAGQLNDLAARPGIRQKCVNVKSGLALIRLRGGILAGGESIKIVNASDSIHYREPEHGQATMAESEGVNLVFQKEHLLLDSLTQNEIYTAGFLSWRIAANRCADKAFVYEEKGASA